MDSGKPRAESREHGAKSGQSQLTNKRQSSAGTIHIVASDFNPAIKRGKDHMSSIGTTHIEYGFGAMTIFQLCAEPTALDVSSCIW